MPVLLNQRHRERLSEIEGAGKDRDGRLEICPFKTGDNPDEYKCQNRMPTLRGACKDYTTCPLYLNRARIKNE